MPASLGIGSGRQSSLRTTRCSRPSVERLARCGASTVAIPAPQRKSVVAPSSMTKALSWLVPVKESWKPKSPSLTEMKKPVTVASMVPAPASALQVRRRTAAPSATRIAVIPWSKKRVPIVGMAS